MSADPRGLPSSRPNLTEAGRRLLGSIDAPPTLEGAIPATRRLRTCILRAAELHPDNVCGEWVTEVHRLVDALRQASDGGANALGGLSAQSAASATYRAFAIPSESTLTAARAANIDAAIGLMLTAEAALGRVLPASVISAWQTLHLSGRPRKGRHEGWKALVDSFPMDAVAAKAQEVGAPLPAKAFLAAYTRALGAKAPSPASLFAPGSRSKVDRRETSAEQGTGHARVAKAAGPTEDAENDDVSPLSFIGWLRERSVRSGYLARFGVEGRWDLQTKAETISICTGIRQALVPDHPSRHFAVLAVVSLCSALPSRLATAIKLQANSDIWLDLRTGALRWYLIRLLDGDRAAATPSDAVEEARVVDVWLPAAAVAITRELQSTRPDAEDVFELIFGPVPIHERLASLTAYRAWLHSIGHRSLHGVEDARFSRSLGQFYREQSGDVVAALLGLDFDEVALGMLHYVGFTRRFLHRQNEAVYQRIGLGGPMPLGLPDAMVGSQVVLTAQQFSIAVTTAFASADAAASAMQAATTAADLISAWNRLVQLRLLLTVELTAGRGDRMERLTWAAVLGHDNVLLHADKNNDEYTKTRLVPIVRALRSVLDAHARDLRQLCDRAALLGLTVRSPHGKRFDQRSPCRICFYGAEVAEHDGNQYLRRVGIKRADLEALCRTVFDRPLNVGRHTLITLCVMHGVEPALIKTLSGHVSGHAEPYSDGQGLSPMNGLSLLGAALEC